MGIKTTTVPGIVGGIMAMRESRELSEMTTGFMNIDQIIRGQNDVKVLTSRNHDGSK